MISEKEAIRQIVLELVDIDTHAPVPLDDLEERAVEIFNIAKMAND